MSRMHLEASASEPNHRRGKVIRARSTDPPDPNFCGQHISERLTAQWNLPPGEPVRARPVPCLAADYVPRSGVALRRSVIG
jgi:hypothetical protein